MTPPKKIDLASPPHGTMLVTLNTGEQHLNVPLGIFNRKHGEKYQAYDMTGKKSGRASYVVSNPEEFGISIVPYTPRN